MDLSKRDLYETFKIGMLLALHEVIDERNVNIDNADSADLDGKRRCRRVRRRLGHTP